MGRFASHLKVVAAQDADGRAYVGYDALAALAGGGADAFRTEWRAELARCAADFDAKYAAAQRAAVAACFAGGGGDAYDVDHPALASAEPGARAEAVLDARGRDFLVGVLAELAALARVATLNAEALHLALRKKDKRAAAAAEKAGESKPSTGASLELLPELYASSLHHGARTLGAEAEAVREVLAEQDGDDGEEEFRAKHLEAEATKESEYQWFLDHMKGMDEEQFASLVAHRGFHDSEGGDSVARPTENSLASFEYAWGAGVHLCECDVGVTKDEKVIMAHDENFRRLALLSGAKSSTVVVRDLTLAEVMRMPLKSGTRPPLLVDVLRSAMAIGENAKLVIEIKPGNSEIVAPLMALFDRHPDLLSRVAVIMSFDAYVIQEIADKFAIKALPFAGVGGLASNGEGQSARTTLQMRKSMRHMRRSRRLLPMQSVSYGMTASAGEGHVPELIVVTAYAKRKHDCLYTNLDDGYANLAEKLPLGSGIDGVYLEYQPGMLEGEGKATMLRLAEQYTVGVWMLKPRDPDVLSIASRLVKECGVSYVNTDFARDFFTN